MVEALVTGPQKMCSSISLDDQSTIYVYAYQIDQRGHDLICRPTSHPESWLFVTLLGQVIQTWKKIESKTMPS